MKIRKRGGIVLGVILAILTCNAIHSQPNGNGNDHGNGKGGHGNGNGNGHGPGDGGGGGPAPAEAPHAVNDAATTAENTPVAINVLANDTDADADIDPATVDLNVALAGVQSTATTPNGDYAGDANGVVTFTPAADFSGSASTTYTVNDISGLTSNPANITVDVASVNAAPVAVNDSGTTPEETEIEINVLANDSDSDGTLDTSKVDLNPSQGGIQKSSDNPEGKWSVNKGNIKFKPANNFVGTATLQYVVYDNDNSPSNAATVTVTVSSTNVAPVAGNDTGGTTLNNPVSVNVVANDSDSDGSLDLNTVDLNTTTAGVQKTANTGQGSWSVNAQGVVTYTPIALFLGTATLNYTVSDNRGAASNIATLTITVQALNLAPIAANDNVTTAKNKAVTINVTQNDSDIDGTLDVTKVDLNPTLAGIQNTAETDQGDYVVNPQGVVTFTPANNFTGLAAITYTVADNAGATSNAASINITVQNVNAAPVAADDTGATSQNIAVTVNVVANDIDSDGVIDAAKVDLNTTLAGIQASRNTPQGEFTASNLGIVTYTPKKDFTGTATLEYTVNDNNGAASNKALITIAVQPHNAPVANEDVDTTKMNTSIRVNVVANDRDTDGSIDAATVDLDVTKNGVQDEATTPEGSYQVNDDGLVTYTPTDNFIGLASIQYTVKDDKGVLSNPAVINITVIEIPNLAPEIIAFEEETDTLRYTPGNPMAITELFEVSDGDDDSLTVAEVGFVSEFYSRGNDKLIFNNTSRIKGEFNEETGLLTLSGPARIDTFEDAIRTVKFEYAGTGESKSNVKRFYVRVSDGIDFSDLKQRFIKINSGVTELDIPTAFTPNSDGANDTWRILAPADISGPDFADAEVRVYDKRGTVVFGANGLENTWDGTFQGKQLPVDTYYYTIDLKQQQKRFKGVVAILR